MIIYASTWLEIKVDSSKRLFVMNWLASPPDFNRFKTEMQNYVELFLNHNGLHAIWLQKNFKFRLTTEHFNWIEHNVNRKCYINEVQKTAFVIGKDAVAHFGVIDSFEKTDFPINNVQHLATQQDAMDWIFGTPKVGKLQKKSTVLFKGVNKNGMAVLEVESPAEIIGNTLVQFKLLLEKSQFMTQNIDKFALLTNREKQIVGSYASGLNHVQSAEKLNVSVHTVRTHWRNIKQKLNMQSGAQILHFARAFNIQ